jgi:AcrR family transcriptional regulator
MGNEIESLANRDVLATTLAPDAGLRAREARVLEAMAAVCAERTYAAATISEIVRSAGISTRTFYKLFASKRECFDAALAAFSAELEAAVEAARAGEQSWPAEVRAAIAAILEASAAKPDFAKLAFVESIGVDPNLIGHYRLVLAGALARQRAGGLAAQPAPAGGRPPQGTRAAFGRAQVLIADQITSGRAAELPELLPDLVYIALSPFTGPEEALREALAAR